MPATTVLRRSVQPFWNLIPDATLLGAHLPSVRRCTDDIWSVAEGDLFACISGPQFDGHDLAQQAVRRGAAGLLVERLVPCDLPQILTSDSREALGKLAHALAGEPAQKLKVIGVAGTLGKTCVATLLTSILEQAEQTVISADDLAVWDGDRFLTHWGQTPSPQRIVDWLQAGVTNGASHAVLEMSSAGLASRKFSGLTLDSLVLTNVRRDHLNLHGSLANYRQALSRALTYLDAGGAVITSADDAGAQAITTRWHGPLLTVSLNDRATISARVVERSAAEQIFTLTTGSDTALVRTRMVGDAHLESCLLAAAMGLVHAIDLPLIVKGLEAVESIPGRLERVEQGQNFSVFLQQANRPVVLQQALRTVREVTSGRVLCALDLTDMDSPEMAEQVLATAVKGADQLWVSGATAGSRRLAAGTSGQTVCAARFVGNRMLAIDQALRQAQAGDCVLIAGSVGELGPRDLGNVIPLDRQERLLRAA